MRRILFTTAVLFCFSLLLLGGLVYAGYNINIFIDGNKIESDVAPQLIQDRTMVPIRVISEFFGADVGWVQETMTVEITSPYQKFMDSYDEKGMYVKQAGEVQPMVKRDEAVVLDVRGLSLRDRSYITGSIHIPMTELLNRLAEIPTDKAVAVYCAKNINASYAVTFLNMLGYEAYLLEDGMEAWDAVGGEITLCRR